MSKTKGIAIGIAVLLLTALAVLADDVMYGPTAAVRGTTIRNPPAIMGAAAYPSPNASPVARGQDFLTTDGQGRLWVKMFGSISSSISSISGTVNTTTTASSTAQGMSTYCTPSFAGGSSEVTVSPSPANLYSFSVSNPNTTDVYLEFWDATNPVVGTTAPLACHLIPAGLGSSNRGWRDEKFDPPITCSTALTCTVVTAANGSSTPTSPVTLNVGFR
jgi:hypothetical protein